MSENPSIALWMTGWLVASGVALSAGFSTDGLGFGSDSPLDDSGISTPDTSGIDPEMERKRPSTLLMEDGMSQYLYGPYMGRETCNDALTAMGVKEGGSSVLCDTGSDGKWYFWWAE